METRFWSFFGHNSEELSTLAEENKVVRCGLKLMNWAVVLETASPLVALVAVFLLSAVSTFAQSGGGPIFVPDNGQFGRAVVGFIRLIYQGLFVLGFVATAWFIFNIVTEKAWTKQLIGAVCCWGAGLIAMVVYQASRGQVIQFDTTTFGGN